MKTLILQYVICNIIFFKWWHDQKNSMFCCLQYSLWRFNKFLEKVISKILLLKWVCQPIYPVYSIVQFLWFSMSIYERFHTVPDPSIWQSVSKRKPSRFQFQKITFPNLGEHACPAGYGYLLNLGKCVKIYTHGEKQSDAEFSCSITNGGHLVSIHNAFQKREILGNIFGKIFIREFLGKCANQNFHIGRHIFAISDYIAEQGLAAASPYLWLGLMEENNQYTWTDGSTFDYHSWAPGEPTAKGHCATMGSGGAFSGDWTGNGCDETWGFVCQTDPIGGLTTASPGHNCPDGWTKFDPTNACYRVR